MAAWLLKTEPSDYSIDDLKADGKTIWDGVANALALKHLRNIRAGDRLLIYHTGNVKAIVGSAVAVSDAAPRKGDSKDVVVEIRYDCTWPNTVSLADMKDDKAFDGWELLRLPRLSVMPVPPAVLTALETRLKDFKP
ncbi:MAG: EVE domain-containing protein [Phycisphaerae bacterium]